MTVKMNNIKAYIVRKFEYFLNAVFYCMWRFDMRFSELSEVIFFGFINAFCSIFLPERFLQKLKDRQIAAKQQLETICHDVEYGINVIYLARFLYFLSVGYAGFLTFLILGIVWNIDNNTSRLIDMLVVLMTYGPALEIVDWTVIDNSRYLRFFEEFTQEDEAWHRKWNRITLLFCIGSVLSTVLGIASALLITIYFS